MSILTKALGVLGFVASLPERALHLAESVLHGLQAAWSFLVSIASVLSDAWTWVVNGAFWLGDRIAGWAGEVYRTLWQTLVHTIPDAIAWVFAKAVRWAAGALRKVWGELTKAIHDAKRFLTRLIHDLVNALKAALHSFIHWATEPIRWVLRWGAWLIKLITHPGNLANWIAGAILEPVVKWFLKAGASVVVWFLRASLARGSALVHLIENVLHDML